MSIQLELPFIAEGESQKLKRSEELRLASQDTERLGASDLMAKVLSRPNLQTALKRVRKNKGSPGIDGMAVNELADYLHEHWPAIREQLLSSRYRPSAIKRQLIPKSGGGKRELGIPTVLDRFIQQAILQVLTPIFDPNFSDYSYGFRPKRSAHQAVRQAQRFVQGGRRIVVDVDLSKFFDRVHHDMLMSRLARKVSDKCLLGLIRRYLSAGVLVDGVVMSRDKGTPQGGPLSPLLANILLDEVDKELAASGHAFVRYADDCNVYVSSERAGHRVMKRLRRLYSKLGLVVNEEKSAVAPALERSFLGFNLWRAWWAGGDVRHGVSQKALVRMKERVRVITGRSRGRCLAEVVQDLRSYLVGWKNYFSLAQTPGVFANLDGWIRRRLRAVLLKQWKRGKTVYRELRALGIKPRLAAEVASKARHWWNTAGTLMNIALPISFFDKLGVPKLAE